MLQSIKNFYHLAQALLASLYFGFPSKRMTIIGVTGTDGKSTTSAMIYQILKDAGKKVGLVNSIGIRIGSKTYQTSEHVTTPSSFKLQHSLKIAKEKKLEYFVIEATSHALDQNRLAFIPFRMGVLTNVSHEHLDYHKSWRNYLLAKTKLFRGVQFAVLNLSDKSYELVKSKVDGKILTYGNNQIADFNLQNFPLKLGIIGNYNEENALAAAAATTALGVDKKTILKSLANFNGIIGRMQKVNLGQKFSVFIDFAHTPNALEKACAVLKSVAQKRKGRLVIVFGAAGERDRLKRPQMGKVAAKVSEKTILTAEDPRSENAGDICNQIAEGLLAKGKKKNRDFFIILDRKEAILYAIKIAKAGDVLGIFGKGHENLMSFKDKDIPWDEFRIVKQAILAKIQK